MNQIGNCICPSVICQRQGPYFRWQESDGEWCQADALPQEIAETLPLAEWSRCEVHRFRRMGEE